MILMFLYISIHQSSNGSNNFHRCSIVCVLKRKEERAQEEERNIAAGNPGDVDFIGLVQKWRNEHFSDALALTDH